MEYFLTLFSDFYGRVLTQIGGLAALVVLAAFLAKLLIKNSMARQLEEHRLRLEHDLNIHKMTMEKDKEVMMERLKSELIMLTNEHQIAFGRVYQRQADVIDELYKNLIAIQKRAQNLVHGLLGDKSEGRRAEIREIIKDTNALIKTTDDNRLYLGSETAEMVNQLISKIYWSINGYDTALTRQEIYLRMQSPQLVDKAYEKEDDARGVIINDIPPIIVNLEARFASLLKIKGTGV